MTAPAKARWRKIPPLSRLERLIVSRTDGQGDCWRTALKPRPDGYVKTGIYGKATYVHRFAFLVVRGPTPPDTELDHLCRNRWCVNPHHLEPVSHLENMQRGVARCAKLTHCRRGHSLAGENVYRNAGRRHCRACRNGYRSRRASQ